MEVDIRTELERVSLRMQRVFSKRFNKISKILTVYLSYEKNPNFSVYSQYAIYKVIESEIAELDRDIRMTVTEQIEYAYLLGYAMSLMNNYNDLGTVYTLESILAEVKIMTNFGDLVKLKEATTADLLQVTRNTEYAVKKFIRDTMSKHLTLQNMKNLGREDLVNLMSKELTGTAIKKATEENMIAIVDRAGRRWKTDVYVDMVVQTKAHQVYVQGISDFARENNGAGDLAKIPFNPTTVDDCLMFEGMIISMTGATAGYRTYDELRSTGLIFHPRCRHHPEPYWDESFIPEDALKKHKQVLKDISEQGL